MFQFVAKFFQKIRFKDSKFWHGKLTKFQSWARPKSFQSENLQGVLPLEARSTCWTILKQISEVTPARDHRPWSDFDFARLFQYRRQISKLFCRAKNAEKFQWGAKFRRVIIIFWSRVENHHFSDMFPHKIPEKRFGAELENGICFKNFLQNFGDESQFWRFWWFWYRLQNFEKSL